MTEEQIETEGNEEESPVIRTLRKENRELKKQLAGEERLRQEVRAEIERENAAKGYLADLGYPEKLYDKLDLGEVDLSLDGIADALSEQLGFSVDPSAPTQTQTEETPTQAVSEPPKQHQDLQRVADLSSRVRAIADGGSDPSASLSRKIAGAQSEEELVQIMSEAGLATSY